jgi:hypothetical protein
VFALAARRFLGLANQACIGDANHWMCHPGFLPFLVDASRKPRCYCPVLGGTGCRESKTSEALIQAEDSRLTLQMWEKRGVSA